VFDPGTDSNSNIARKAKGCFAVLSYKDIKQDKEVRRGMLRELTDLLGNGKLKECSRSVPTGSESIKLVESRRCPIFDRDRQPHLTNAVYELK
jgi:hypothetical protein